MDRIASFTINHLDLMPGLYVSRRDAKGDCVTTTFDLRITAPVSYTHLRAHET